MTLNKLSPSQKKKGRWLLHLSDGTILRLGEGDVAAFGLYSGMELSEEDLTRLRAAAERTRTRETALNMITARPLSRSELERKLERREAAEEEISAAADWLEDLGLLNDGEYARQLVRHYAARGYGARKIRDELYRRGVPREYWDEAMEERQDPAEAIDAFLTRKLGSDPEPDPRELKRCTDALCRRGFSWSEISAGLRRRGTQVEED